MAGEEIGVVQYYSIFGFLFINVENKSEYFLADPQPFIYYTLQIIYEYGNSVCDVLHS